MSARGIAGSSLTLVGPGRAGSALARSWIEAGGTLRQIVSRDRPSADEAVRRLGSGSPATLATSGGICDVLVISVPDDAIAGVAEALAGRVLCRFAFHLSGALSSRLLDPLRKAGASAGSVHPLRPFHGDPRENWRGVVVAIEGDPEAVEEAGRVAEALGATGHFLDTAGKPLYHAAATMAAGGTVALLSMSTRLWESLGIPEGVAKKALAGLSQHAARAVEAHSFEQAFTGPVARRDLETVRAHEKALRGRKDLVRLYSALAEETLARTAGRGREEQVRALLVRNRKGRGKSSSGRGKMPTDG